MHASRSGSSQASHTGQDRHQQRQRQPHPAPGDGPSQEGHSNRLAVQQLAAQPFKAFAGTIGRDAPRQRIGRQEGLRLPQNLLSRRRVAVGLRDVLVALAYGAKQRLNMPAAAGGQRTAAAGVLAVVGLAGRSFTLLSLIRHAATQETSMAVGSASSPPISQRTCVSSWLGQLRAAAAALLAARAVQAGHIASSPAFGGRISPCDREPPLKAGGGRGEHRAK